MPRIRTVKPEFWEDEVVGLLPRDARLLFIATFNMADDEGLLRWTPSYVKASAFMYDDDLVVADVGKLMHCLADAGLVFPYIAGLARQQMSFIVNFRKHQRVNRPQKSKLPPPPLHSSEVRLMYARRDGWTCRLCGEGIPQQPVLNRGHNLAVGHIRPQNAGGTDHPSNVRAVHEACHRSRPQGDGEEFVPPAELAGLSDSLNSSVNDWPSGQVDSPDAERSERTSQVRDPYTQSDISSVNGSVNDSLTNSLWERKGKEEERNTPPTPQAINAEGQTPAQHASQGEDLPGRMADEFMKRYARGNTYSLKQVRSVIASSLSNQVDPDELWAALLEMGERSKPITLPSLQFAFSKIRQARNGNVVDIADARPSTTDSRVGQGQALAAMFREQEQRQLAPGQTAPPQESA